MRVGGDGGDYYGAAALPLNGAPAAAVRGGPLGATAQRKGKIKALEDELEALNAQRRARGRGGMKQTRRVHSQDVIAAHTPGWGGASLLTLALEKRPAFNP